MSDAKKGGNGAKRKTDKSKEQKTKELGSFAAGVIAAGVASSKTSGKGKTKGRKFAKGLVTFVVAAAVLFCGGMYYFDLSPFDFTLTDSDFFKYYSYENYDYYVSMPAGADAETENGELKIHYIDVGQGDCVFIQFPDGETMLIDGGKKSSVLAQGIIDYLTALYPNQEKITVNYCMLTHCDSDHCGSLDDVIASDKIDVLCVYQPMVYSAFENDPLAETYPDGCYATITTTVYEDFVEAVWNEMNDGVLTEIKYNLQGESFSGDGWTVKLYNPTEQMYAKLNTAQDKNNISPIMVLSCQGVKILLTGDADDAAEQNFLANVENDMFGDGFDGDVDVLKVAHHGGEQSTSAEFLAVVQPEYGVISVGENNTYGHPGEATLNRLAAASCVVYRTDLNGNVILTVSDGAVSFSLAKTVAVNAAIRIYAFAA